jgi:hypothetical protein
MSAYKSVIEGDYDSPRKAVESISQIPKTFRLSVLLDTVKYNLEHGEVAFASEIVSEFGYTADF